MARLGRRRGPARGGPTTCCGGSPPGRPTGRLADDNGQLRLLLPVVGWEEFLAVAVDEVVQYAEGSGQVLARLRSMLADLREVARPEHRAAVDRRLAAMRDAEGVPAGR